LRYGTIRILHDALPIYLRISYNPVIGNAAHNLDAVLKAIFLNALQDTHGGKRIYKVGRARGNRIGAAEQEFHIGLGSSAGVPSELG